MSEKKQNAITRLIKYLKSDCNLSDQQISEIAALVDLYTTEVVKEAWQNLKH